MLSKIVAIKNIGRFRSYTASGNVKLKRNTIILGGNGHGKTTLCAILRSLQANDPSHILGRQSVDAKESPTVKLIAGGKVNEFDGGSWKSEYSRLAVFDSEFVNQNIYSGDVVDLGHKRNLYQVIIGEAGVRLASEEFDTSKRSRGKTREITAIENRIMRYIPLGIRLSDFIGLPSDPNIADQIKNQERNLRAHQRAQQINDRAHLSKLVLPLLPRKFRELLTVTVDEIAKGAEDQLKRHLTAHRIGSDGRNWISKGFQYTRGKDCPFCGQDIEGLPLINAYRSVFSKKYKDLRSSITFCKRRFEKTFGEREIGRLTNRSERNRAVAEFWRQYCNIGPSDFTLPPNTPQAMRDLRRAAMNLLDRKSQAPLDAIQIRGTAFESAVDAYRNVISGVKDLAERITTANEAINQLKSATQVPDVRSAKARLSYLNAIKIRHELPVNRLCKELRHLTIVKKDLERDKIRLRDELNNYTNRVVAPFERRINRCLKYFGAGFTIKNTLHTYLGGQPTSSYQLVINRKAVEIGDSRTSNETPSFKNTLSSGDRSTLALAFFLSRIEGDQDLSRTTVVFDDPFNSQDSFRRTRTINEIARFAKQCVQVITLSHDPRFLKEIWDNAPAAERAALKLFDARVHGTMIMELDIDRECETTTAADLRELETFVRYNEGDPADIKRKLRPVLEHHLRTAYSTSFTSTQLTLGTMAGIIRKSGPSHPAASLLPSLEEINKYSRRSHHAEDPLSTSSTAIDRGELLTYVQDTLQIVDGG